MNETSERFLKAILERVGSGRVVEIHLFPPIRQGQMETGVAVVAAAPLAEQGSGPRAPDDPPELPADSRLEVLTAWYRLTRKGPDRGKWEVDLKVEADAPLATVGAVVRGVQQRLGEAVEPERLPVERLHAWLSEPARSDATWQTSQY